MTPEQLTFLSLVGGLITVPNLVVAWKVIRALNRLESVMKDYPPHRHEDGLIIYPHDFKPTQAQHLKVSAGQR
jgi:hypothetical protein